MQCSDTQASDVWRRKAHARQGAPRGIRALIESPLSKLSGSEDSLLCVVHAVGVV